MQPFYHIQLDHRPPSLDEITAVVGAQQRRDTADTVNHICVDPIRSELCALGLQSLNLQLWQWQFDQGDDQYIHSDGRRSAAINWCFTDLSCLEFFDTQGGRQWLDRQNRPDGEFLATYWYWLGPAPLIAQWRGPGPVLIDPQQPHRPRSLAAQQQRRVTLTLNLAHTFQEAFELLDRAGRISADK